MYLFYDYTFWVLVGPAMLLALLAQLQVKLAYSRASKIPNSRGVSGAEAARTILDANRLQHIAVEPHQGFLSDHYDPKHKVLRLSPDVHDGRSLAAVGIAAHEA